MEKIMFRLRLICYVIDALDNCIWIKLFPSIIQYIIFFIIIIQYIITMYVKYRFNNKSKLLHFQDPNLRSPQEFLFENI